MPASPAPRRIPAGCARFPLALWRLAVDEPLAIADGGHVEGVARRMQREADGEVQLRRDHRPASVLLDPEHAAIVGRERGLWRRRLEDVEPPLDERQIDDPPETLFDGPDRAGVELKLLDQAVEATQVEELSPADHGDGGRVLDRAIADPGDLARLRIDAQDAVVVRLDHIEDLADGDHSVRHAIGLAVTLGATLRLDLGRVGTNERTDVGHVLVPVRIDADDASGIVRKAARAAPALDERVECVLDPGDIRGPQRILEPVAGARQAVDDGLPLSVGLQARDTPTEASHVSVQRWGREAAVNRGALFRVGRQHVAARPRLGDVEETIRPEADVPRVGEAPREHRNLRRVGASCVVAGPCGCSGGEERRGHRSGDEGHQGTEPLGEARHNRLLHQGER